jgi:hypothetical protein
MKPGRRQQTLGRILLVYQPAKVPLLADDGPTDAVGSIELGIPVYDPKAYVERVSAETSTTGTPSGSGLVDSVPILIDCIGL